MPKLAIIDENHQVRIVSDPSIWCQKFYDCERIVKQEHVKGCYISTVFLGVDHGFESRPIWFETMVFRGSDRRQDLDLGQWRYTTLFLGVDQRVWFETMVFSGLDRQALGEDLGQWRYTTWDEAARGHEAIKQMVV